MHASRIDQARDAASIKVMHDARAVHDMALLNLVDLLKHGIPQWTVARVTPAANSGFVTIADASINAETGELVASPNSPVVLMKRGTWTAVAASQLRIVSNEAYSLTKPFRQVTRSRTAEDYYSPFVDGGTVIVLTTRPWTSWQELGPVYLIFDDWASDLPEAMLFVVKHLALFQALGGAESELMDLLSRDNALLQVEAFRRLITMPDVTHEPIEKRLSSASIHLAPVFTYLLLTERKDNNWEERLVALVHSAKQDTTCLGIAVGAYAARLFFSNDSKISQNATSVLAAARSRLALSMQQDKYLTKLLSD